MKMPCKKKKVRKEEEMGEMQFGHAMSVGIAEFPPERILYHISLKCNNPLSQADLDVAKMCK